MSIYLRYAPAVLGFALLVAGLAWVWPPLGLIAAGLLLLALDRRL